MDRDVLAALARVVGDGLAAEASSGLPGQGDSGAASGLVDALLDLVPRGADGRRDWCLAPSLLREHLAGLADSAGRLEELAVDARFLAYAFAQSRAGRVTACRLHGGDLSVMWPVRDEGSGGSGVKPGARPVRGWQPWSPA